MDDGVYYSLFTQKREKFCPSVLCSVVHIVCLGFVILWFILVLFLCRVTFLFCTHSLGKSKLLVYICCFIVVRVCMLTSCQQVNYFGSGSQL